MRQSVHQQIDEAALREALLRGTEAQAITYTFQDRAGTGTVDKQTGARTSTPTTAQFSAMLSFDQVEAISQQGGGLSSEVVTAWCFAVEGEAFSTRDFFTVDSDATRWQVETVTKSPGGATWLIVARRTG